MKNLILASILTLCFFSCKDRESDPNVLPEATQSGKNTAGALVDGKVWIATTEFIYPKGTYCENFGNKTKIALDLRQIKNKGSNSIEIIAVIEGFELNKTYTISENPEVGYNFANYTNGNGVSFLTNPNYTGKIKITRLDLQNQIVSGTFEFKAVDDNGNIVNITDGRFDKKFD